MIAAAITDGLPPRELWLVGEEWRPVPAWDGRYLVSSAGRVWAPSRATETFNRRRGWCVVRRRGRMVTTLVNSGGYVSVALMTRTAKRSVLVHRLVAEAFLPPPEQGREFVNHIDHNRTNNAARNLEWVNHSENMLAAHKHRGDRTARQRRHRERFSEWLDAGRRLARGRGDLAAAIEAVARTAAAEPVQRELFGEAS